MRGGWRQTVRRCDILDVGGESPRTGAVPVSEAEEIAGVRSMLRKFADTLDIPLPIDTYTTYCG